jgi:Xaa-Pro aminopeptidase
VIDAIDAWLDIRKVKTAQEIDFLRRGATINEAGLREILPLIRPGTVWREVAARFRNAVQERGANLLSAQKALQSKAVQRYLTEGAAKLSPEAERLLMLLGSGGGAAGAGLLGSQ